ncbi:MAG: prepilin-type N-terminal cleavage/methylation domain-containing protein [Phycisphaerae bacterium]|jgi:prepilin-type N-terminal cleavage/methylation domain-containing protein
MVKSRRSAFTLIELLVVVAIIALLISILLPSLSQAREQGKKAVCMSNLKSLAQASHAYATDDRREQIVPLHISHARIASTGFGSEWCWRTAEPYAYGGRTPTKPFTGNGGNTEIMMDEDGIWAAHTRPLNRYVYGDIDQADSKKLEMYHCPSDKGYPDNVRWVQDAPNDCAEIPLYDMLGNGYRINTCGMLWVSGAQRQASVSVSAWGHAASTIDNPSRTVLYSEPLFYNFSRQEADEDPTLVPIEGWHRRVMSDNVAYCDGSGKMTRVDQLSKFDGVTIGAMNVTRAFPWNYFLRRGRTWQTDCYPSPGALFLVFGPTGAPIFDAMGYIATSGYRGWPFDGIRPNLAPD